MLQSVKYCILAGAFLFVCNSLNAQQDTIILKNGLYKPGYIYKIADNKIYLANGNDSSVYTAKDTKMLMFCHTIRSNQNCDESGKSNSSLAKNYSNRGISKGNNTSNNKAGYAEFTCTACGGNGRIEIINTNCPGIVIDEFLVRLNADESYFTYTAYLPAGRYDWRYCDTEKNATKGSFTIEKGSELRVGVLAPTE